ncbi:MAG: aminoglycoside phosphotransferase family protein [Actinomycetota bacterium]
MPEVTPAIPQPSEVDEAFLTAVLRSAGHDVTVDAVDAGPVGTGQVGQCIRYRMSLSGDTDGCPSSLVGKFASDDERSRSTGVALRSYLKEVRFYQQLAERVSIPLPRCYHSAIDGEGPDFVLILEDLAPAEQGDQLDGCTVTEAEAAVAALVGLHAPTWDDPSLVGIDWLGGRPSTGGDRAAPSEVAPLYGQLMGSFFDRFGDRLEADERQIIEQVASSSGPPWYHDGPTSLIHVDYRLDNLLFDHRRHPPAVTAVDWQSVTVGNPLSDVAYFIGAGLLPEVRRPAEKELVWAYHRDLVAAGVDGYGWEGCWDDYRRGSFHGFAITVIAATIVVETERGNDMFTAMARRHARHAIDLGAAEFL